MITLVNGSIQSASHTAVSNGSISLQLNVDATVIAAPNGFVCADIPIVFQFDANGNLIQPCAIWSNAELNPQNSLGLGTYYLVTLYDQNGARLNAVPMWWQFPEAAGAMVDISSVVPISTIGGNVIFYPTNFAASVSSISFTGDGILFVATPGTPVTTSGTLTPVLIAQVANTVLAGPTTGANATPTFRALVAADIPFLPASGVSAAGSNKQLQFNDGGVFAGAALSVWDKTTGNLTLQASADNQTPLSLTRHSATQSAALLDVNGSISVHTELGSLMKLVMAGQGGGGAANPNGAVLVTDSVYTGSRLAIYIGSVGNHLPTIAGTTSGTPGGIPVQLEIGDTSVTIVNGGFNVGALGQEFEVTAAGLIFHYNNIQTTGNGIPVEYATVDLTAQAAAIATTTLYAVPAAGAGQYRVSWNAHITTVDGASSTLGALTIVYTSTDSVVHTITCGAQSNAGAIETTDAGNVTTTVLLGLPLLLSCKASTNITYAFAYASGTPGTMKYSLHLKLEAL